MKTRIMLFEDHLLGDMSPITLTRPAFAVTCACATLHDIARETGSEVGWIVRDYLAGTVGRRYPRIPYDASGPWLFLNASLLPDMRYAVHIRELIDAGRPFVSTAGSRVSAALLPTGATAPGSLSSDTVTPWLLELKLPLLEEERFRTLDHQFEVIKHLQPLFEANIEHRIRSGGYREIRAGVFAAENVSIAETAVFKTGDGPILLDRDVVVADFTYLVGPVHVGARSRIIERASLKEHVSIGETCKIGGEVEASIIEGFTNKQHHGFLGHSWVGSWVNLGAGTSNSDLKNTYGEVRLEYPHRRVETGMQFLGCIIGDYAKSAINTSIFTGKVVGVSSMLYGFVGSNVPSFCNYARSFGQITECPLDQAVLVQKRMFERRGITQSPEDAALLRDVFEMTRAERLLSDEPPAL
jgi:UDP-N-acetylglucosamine diphosphorylase / glucose-1-phosphate thymidylyltransferase / UDP-N-acetylgalactosamine diphosphorylase / glucosamine-1-phosphate N-acetyltransferase / galactosamine-1-phosphate N-acetyltransferase